jgi:uncharacterized protein (TIGR02147 family)
MGKNSAHSAQADIERPKIFGYHDYRRFLKDWFAYLRETDRNFSIRSLSVKAKLGSGYISMILAGERNLTFKILSRISPYLKLNRSENSFLEHLVQLAASEESTDKVIALNRMTRFSSYQKQNPGEAEFIAYMSNWYYVAIREMASLPDFQLDPLWIQGRLGQSVSLENIKTALEFLVRHGYIRAARDGSTLAPKEPLDCQGDVYRTALTRYHQQMLAIASESLESVPDNERDLDGCTFALDQARFVEAKKIINEAMERIVALEKSPGLPADQIYHLEFALFPLTRKTRKGEKK